MSAKTKMVKVRNCMPRGIVERDGKIYKPGEEFDVPEDALPIGRNVIPVADLDKAEAKRKVDADAATEGVVRELERNAAARKAKDTEPKEAKDDAK